MIHNFPSTLNNSTIDFFLPVSSSVVVHCPTQVAVDDVDLFMNNASTLTKSIDFIVTVYLRFVVKNFSITVIPFGVNMDSG